VSIIRKRIHLLDLPLLLTVVVMAPRLCRGQEAEKQTPKVAPPNAVAPGAVPAQEELPSPPEIPHDDLANLLPTTPVRRDQAAYNYQMVNAALLPRDKEGIWVLDFAFKPLRIRTVELPGKGRRPVHYLYYKVVNRTGKPRLFAPQFIMVNEGGKRFEDQVISQAIPLIHAREDATIPLRGAVDVIGRIPPSTKEGVDDAVYGVAVWDNWDPKADRFSIYVRGLSDGYKEIPNPKGGKPIAKYKTLRIDFIRRGDDRNLNEKEIEFGDPVYEWVYW
jgi:hypothetical protein